jgi:ribonuclease P/MRP protein subunit RPP40
MLCGSILQETKCIRDLGVMFNGHLEFSDHISGIISKAKQRIFLLHKCFVTKDPATLVLAFNTYILPILDYASPIWSPHHHCDVARLESVQRTFTKRLRGYDGLSYTDRLLKAGLVSLELRRVRADLVLCYKIVRGLLFTDVRKYFTIVDSSTTRGHPWKLTATKPRLDTMRHFFAYRTARVWNSLSPEVVCSPNVALFASNLTKQDLSRFLTA